MDYIGMVLTDHMNNFVQVHKNQNMIVIDYVTHILL